MPISKKQLLEIVDSGDTSQFYRKPEIQKAYEDRLNEIKRDWLSVEDYVVQEIIRPGNLKAKWCVTDNEFPYDFDPSLWHRVLWLYNTPESEIVHILGWVSGFVIAWENPTKTRSVKKVRHIHVISERPRRPSRGSSPNCTKQMGQRSL